MDSLDFTPVAPWPLPARQDCAFYTCMDIADGETVEGVHWDIRGGFDVYVGGYPLAGKSVLDVGTASGFLAFSAEAAGAASVTAIDALHAGEFNRIPFSGSIYTERRDEWIAGTEAYLNALKRSFWYVWHRRGSAVEVLYAPAAELWRWERRFDVVVAGAIVEHISDPVPFLASLAGLAKEAVILAFTPVAQDESLTMKPMNSWENPAFNYSWWELSLGLYRRIFANLGFSVELKTAQALCHEYDPPMLVERPTLVARRVTSGESLQLDPISADSQLEIELAQTKRALAAANERIEQTLNSTSWRITRPLRVLAARLRPGSNAEGA